MIALHEKSSLLFIHSQPVRIGCVVSSGRDSIFVQIEWLGQSSLLFIHSQPVRIGRVVSSERDSKLVQIESELGCAMDLFSINVNQDSFETAELCLNHQT